MSTCLAGCVTPQRRHSANETRRPAFWVTRDREHNFRKYSAQDCSGRARMTPGDSRLT